MYPVPTECPVCHDDLLVTRLVCRNCGTGLEGRFTMGRLFQLTPEQLHFVEIFLRCEGKINRVQEEVGLSYPTVRSRLEPQGPRDRRRTSPAHPGTTGQPGDFIRGGISPSTGRAGLNSRRQSSSHRWR